MDLRELLAKADLANELEFEVQGQKFKLGDLRGFSSGIESERRELAERSRKAEAVAREAQDMLGALKTALEEAEKSKVAPKEEPKKADWRKNPLYEELVPVFEALENQVKSSTELANKTRKDLDSAQATYAAERLRREWAEATHKPKEAKFEDVVKEVLTRGDRDSLGLPSLSRWLHEAGEGTRMENAVAEAVKKNNADWEQRMRMAGTSKPTSGLSKFTTSKAKEAPIKNLDQLTSEVVASDPDIAAAMNGETV